MDGIRATHPSEAWVFFEFGRVVAEIPPWLASTPRRGWGTVVVTVADIEPYDIGEVEWVGNCAGHRKSNYSEDRDKTHGKVYLRRDRKGLGGSRDSELWSYHTHMVSFYTWQWQLPIRAFRASIRHIRLHLFCVPAFS